MHMRRCPSTSSACGLRRTACPCALWGPYGPAADAAESEHARSWHTRCAQLHRAQIGTNQENTAFGLSDPEMEETVDYRRRTAWPRRFAPQKKKAGKLHSPNFGPSQNSENFQAFRFKLRLQWLVLVMDDSSDDEHEWHFAPVTADAARVTGGSAHAEIGIRVPRTAAECASLLAEAARRARLADVAQSSLRLALPQSVVDLVLGWVGPPPPATHIRDAWRARYAWLQRLEHEVRRRPGSLLTHPSVVTQASAASMARPKQKLVDHLPDTEGEEEEGQEGEEEEEGGEEEGEEHEDETIPRLVSKKEGDEEEDHYSEAEEEGLDLTRGTLLSLSPPLSLSLSR